MGEILLCSHSSPLGEILLYSSFSGGKFYYGGKTTLQHRFTESQHSHLSQKLCNQKDTYIIINPPYKDLEPTVNLSGQAI